MKEDKKRLKDEKRIAKARIRAERERGGSQVGILRQLAGMSTKSDRSKKTHEERLKRQKKARSQAGDVSSFIGYDVIYQDGIAQVEEGLFSQTIEFSDISYQSARRENQQNIFSMRTYTICLPLRNEGFGAIVSAKAASETPAA